MTFSEQFISIMDAVCDKLGIVIDWTTQNVLPYMTEVSGRIIGLEIANSVLWIIISILTIISYFVIMNLIRKRKWDEDGIIAIGIFGGLISFGSTCAIFVQIFDIIQAKFLPEMVIIEFLSKFI